MSPFDRELCTAVVPLSGADARGNVRWLARSIQTGVTAVFAAARLVPLPHQHIMPAPARLAALVNALTAAENVLDKHAERDSMITSLEGVEAPEILARLIRPVASSAGCAAHDYARYCAVVQDALVAIVAAVPIALCKTQGSAVGTA